MEQLNLSEQYNQNSWKFSYFLIWISKVSHLSLSNQSWHIKAEFIFKEIKHKKKWVQLILLSYKDNTMSIRDFVVVV